MKISVDYGFDDHPADGDRPRCGWVVAITDDCDECGDARVDVMIEEEGRAGTGLSLHLAPTTARRLQDALGRALRQLGDG
jgi:hypothetical protein